MEEEEEGRKQRRRKEEESLSPPLETGAPLFGAAASKQRHHYRPPPQHRPKRSKPPPPPPRQVTFLPPHSRVVFPFPSLHAERVAFCMQGWGENNSPPARFGLGQADPGPTLSSGPGQARKRILVFGPRSAQSILGRNRPIPFGAESGPVGWAGPAQPILFNIIYIIFCIIIYIYI